MVNSSIFSHLAAQHHSKQITYNTYNSPTRLCQCDILSRQCVKITHFYFMFKGNNDTQHVVRLLESVAKIPINFGLGKENVLFKTKIHGMT